jgi:hypothetical protein
MELKVIERVSKCGVLTTLFVPWMGEKLDGVTNRPYVISSCDNFVLIFWLGQVFQSLSSSSFSAMDLDHLFQINKINEGLHNSHTHNLVINF